MTNTPSDPWSGVEHDESLADDVLGSASAEDDDGGRPPLRRRSRNPVVHWLAIGTALVVVVVGAAVAFNAVRGLVPSIDIGSSAAEDYEGTGSGEVTIEIPQGAGGGQIAQILADEDVVASVGSFSAAAAAEPDATDIQPGTYLMANQMSGQAALERLLDPEARQVVGVTIREGLWKEEVFAVLADASDFDVADYEEVDPADLDLPEAADGRMEGYLYPETYSFNQDDTPQEQLSTMVERGKTVLDELGVGAEETNQVLTKASIVQGEGAAPEDLPKIARVIENRLAEDEPLSMDSTIHFMDKERGSAGTTDEQREVDDPYNTYLNTGLPPGPINSPGAAAIEAVLDPPKGDWMFFVTVDPSTGETRFAETFEEHQENVELFNAWCRENEDQC